MQRVMVKVCGLQEEEHVVAAAVGGSDYVGLVFAHSRRRVTPTQAMRLVRSLEGIPGRPLVVGVFVNESVHTVNALGEYCGLDLVQLSGDEDAEFCGQVVLPIIRTISVFPWTTGCDVVQQVNRFRERCPNPSLSFLLDTGAAAVRGGTGESFDWRVASHVQQHVPILVAGGVNGVNVAKLIRAVQPAGVDVSSGVERNRRKDAALIAAFVHEVRKTEQEIANGSNLHTAG